MCRHQRRKQTQEVASGHKALLHSDFQLRHFFFLLPPSSSCLPCVFFFFPQEGCQLYLKMWKHTGWEMFSSIKKKRKTSTSMMNLVFWKENFAKKKIRWWWTFARACVCPCTGVHVCQGGVHCSALAVLWHFLLWHLVSVHLPCQWTDGSPGGTHSHQQHKLVFWSAPVRSSLLH